VSLRHSSDRDVIVAYLFAVRHDCDDQRPDLSQELRRRGYDLDDPKIVSKIEQAVGVSERRATNATTQ